jgi:hypothetical protein
MLNLEDSLTYLRRMDSVEKERDQAESMFEYYFAKTKRDK